MTRSRTEPESLQVLRSRAEELLPQAPSPLAALLEPQAHEREIEIHAVELRLQNEALRELHLEVSQAHERYRELFDCAPVAYLALDCASTVLDANLVAGLLLRREHQALVGKKLSTFVDPARTNDFVRHMKRTLSTQQRQSVDLYLILPDGTRREVRLESARSPLDATHWRTALIDLTELRDLQRQAVRATRLETLGSIAAALAHDFSGMFATISSDTDLAFEQPGSGHGSAPLDRIKRAADRGREMLRELTRFVTGSEAGAALLTLDLTIQRAEPALRGLLRLGISLHLDLQAPNSEVCVDLGGLDEILLQLAVNAQYAMPEGGELVIETRIIDTHAELASRPSSLPFALLVVRDTGLGMDASTRARAFQPFFTTRAPGSALGLGLTTVQGIVERAGGRVELTSALNAGTSVQVYLPLTSSARDPSALRAAGRTRVGC